MHRPGPIIASAILLFLAAAGRLFALDSGVDPRPVPDEGFLRILNPWPDAGDRFGSAVALRPDLLAAGSPGDDAPASDAGVVHLFVGGELTGTLEPEPPEPGAAFGSALAAAGGRLAVGAPGGAAGGSVYVFSAAHGGPWQLDAVVRPDAPVPGSAFGQAIALRGRTMLVGAPFERGPNGFKGAAYVFEQTGGKWSQTARLEGAVPSGGIFGAAVDLGNGILAVGAPYLGAQFEPGTVHVFLRAGSGWKIAQRLFSPAFGGRDRFGASVALLGADVLAGAPRDAPPPFGFFSHYEPVRDPSTGERSWEEVQTHTSPDPTPFDRFGISLSLSGHRLLVGALSAGDPVKPGAAYLFELRTGKWVHAGTLEPAGLSDQDFFGTSVSLWGRRAAVGAPGDDSGGMEAGAVWLFPRADDSR